MSNETSRKAFEAWAKSVDLDTSMGPSDAWGQKQYLPHIESMWTGWQAGRKALEAEQAQESKQPDHVEDVLYMVDSEKAKQVAVPAEILSAISRGGLTLIKTQYGYEILKLGPAIAHTATQGDTPCNPHPEAPHGFSRNASHSAGRYVCDCEGWMPDALDESLQGDAQ